MSNRIRVAVVFGGRSTEHAISCISAGSVLNALDRSVFDVVPVGITPKGRWVLAPDDPTLLAIEDGRLPEVADAGDALVLAGDPTNRDLVAFAPGEVPNVLGEVDVVLPILHGPYGEDGTIQGLLELAGVPYVGSGVLSSAAAMDKAVAKVLLSGAGLEQAPYVVITDRQWQRSPADSLARVRDGLATSGVRQACARGIRASGSPRSSSGTTSKVRSSSPGSTIPRSSSNKVWLAERLSAVFWNVKTAGDPKPVSVPRSRFAATMSSTTSKLSTLDDVTELDVPAKLSDERHTASSRRGVCGI